MQNRASLAVAVLATQVSLAFLAVACGSSTTDPAPVVTPPAPTAPVATTPPDPVLPPPPAPLDHGAISTKYPAFTPASGQILSGGGPILKNPVIVTVTWPNDPRAADLENFGDTVGAGAYWTAITSEYGAAAAISGAPNHLRLTDPGPASITDKLLAAFVATNLAAPATLWPIPATGDPVYVLYVPTSTKVMLQGADTCTSGVGGYHDSVSVNGKQVAFAIVPRCGAPLAEMTFIASHELDEATTDPYPNSQPAFRGFRDEDAAWELFLQKQNEVGDACEFFSDSQLSPGASSASLASYTVQRQWSNASGAAGHDPCVPELSGEVYFNMTPLGTEDIQVVVNDSPVVTKGYKIKAGEKRQIPLGFHSAAATGAWTIKAVNASLGGGPFNNDIAFALDVTSGQNGQKAYLTVTVNTASPTNSELVTIVSTRDGIKHYMPFFIGN